MNHKLRVQKSDGIIIVIETVGGSREDCIASHSGLSGIFSASYAKNTAPYQTVRLANNIEIRNRSKKRIVVTCRIDERGRNRREQYILCL